MRHFRISNISKLREAEHGQITVTMGETQQAVGELKSELLRRLFGQQ